MAAKVTPTRAKKTKAEVQEEFEKITEEVVREKVESSPKAEEVIKRVEAEVREAVKDVTVESIAQKMAELGVEVPKALSELSARMVAEAALLSSLGEAVSLERKEIERLHKLDVAATALDQLVESHQQKQAAFQTEMTDARTRWAQEQETRESDQKEFDENLKKQRAREKEEYEYQKALERKKEEDQHEEAVRLEQRKNKERQEALEKSWQVREAALKESEGELAALKQESATFPERLKKETDRAVADALKAVEARHKQELLVLQKDAESEKRLAELRIKSLEDTVARQYAQIEALGQRVEEAKRQVQDIALKAIEGASGANALSHVNKIAMEQAKTRTPQA
ncbi:MAG TPA: hypothetical protein VGP72_01635 [Planctomycetota bacterium]|jgi:hypothetical protein